SDHRAPAVAVDRVPRPALEHFAADLLDIIDHVVGAQKLIVAERAVDCALAHAARMKIDDVVFRFERLQRRPAVARIDDGARSARYKKDVEALFPGGIEAGAEKIRELEAAGRRLAIAIEAGGKRPPIRQQPKFQSLPLQFSRRAHLLPRPALRTVFAAARAR